MFVVYHVAFDKQKDISTYSSGYAGGYGAYGWGWGGGWGGTTTTQVRDILVGTLVIDMADAKKGQLAWRGMGVKEVDTQAKPEKRDKSIINAVNKIFKNYPPKQKASDRRRAARGGTIVTTDVRDAHPADAVRLGRARPVAGRPDRETPNAQSHRVRRVASQRCARGEGRDPHRGHGVHRGRGRGVLADLSRVRRGDVEARRRARRADRRLREQLLDNSPTRWPTSSRRKALDLEARRQAVKAKYYDRVKTALSPRTALRFLQVEHQLLLIIDLQISAALPIAK